MFTASDHPSLSNQAADKGHCRGLRHPNRPGLAKVDCYLQWISSMRYWEISIHSR